MAKSGIGRRRTAALRDHGEGYTQRRNEIIAAGAQVFRDKGFEASSLRDVAERLGTDRASLYYYVASKNELFQLVTQRAVTEVVVAAEAVAAQKGDAESRLRELIVTTVEKYEAHFPYMFVYIQEDMNRIHSSSIDEVWARTMVELGRRFELALMRILEDGDKDDSLVIAHPHLAMNVIIGAVNWTHRWFTPGRGSTGRVLGDQMADMLLDGFRAHP
ncbi:TetR/AcrR family transcriptional regulator [Dactylosporangium sp. NPDC048998]|uniref:TetR/AcrR family transcriptional regulator n=1 Tax=Dactylosporangium sp. NPDC048998 TaxID=3363976 RepID=UPI00371FD149